ncbi:hypothetical protein GALMADRAFT_410617 [Galerina marginata CBS 339.88]|uniref:Uncharacterized protein n=1 Tax=Galerina marginata (strain CBS 339.88) TaxID=685588 RepID=A0A067TFC3_GALM3|nr:hypothetical protein GALMADRAFT_410617 [Galerina marginata CBS 339.88]
MFASVQVNAGNIVSAMADTVISIGQQTQLVVSGGGVKFNPPTAGNAGELDATNMTGEDQGLAVGFIGEGGFPNPLLVWQNVGNENTIQAEFTPIISAYVTSDYQQTQLITGQIVSPVLLNQNLALLPTQQLYTLSMKSDGSYFITADQAVSASPRPKIKFDPGFDYYLQGKSEAISVTNGLSSVILVKVSNADPKGKAEIFSEVGPGQSNAWPREVAETISVNVGGAGRVASYYGIVGKNLYINAA